MSDLSQEEIEDLVKGMQKKPFEREKQEKIPLLKPGTYGKVAKVTFSALDGERQRAKGHVTEEEREPFLAAKTEVEAVYGKTRMSLRELASLKKGSLIPLEELCDDLVDILVEGKRVARGEIVAANGHFGVKIVSFDNP
ncbi:MAG: Flagellar motor switch protein FliN [Chlamydiae bacterium]|nr:Flagellar motor switch protein FliN [Chlamydiota bacterium]